MRRELCIGVDLGGSNLRFALVDRQGRVLARSAEPTLPAAGLDSLLRRLLSRVERLQEEAARIGAPLAALAVGVPGLVCSDGVVRASVNVPALEGVPLARELFVATGMPVAVLNDANACALGEQGYGAGRGYRSLIALTIGTGVGSGLILDGKLWTGVDGAAGEFGHIPVEPEGRPCGCGSRGCLEQYASAGAIARDGEDAAAVARRARLGDAAALAAFAEAGRYLGIAAAGVVNLLNLEAVILCGGVAQSFDLLAPALRRELVSRTFSFSGGRVRVAPGELGDDAGVLGAAVAAFGTVF
ncbi:ROK family protein [Geomonas sp. Red69]|uniref:ROK family protein n=1 Tax=Geomonas diazotrophica TaxID=2843197 RepID=A0ABX8JHS7_9BACT|nr:MULTISPECIES: ROK family protein [Geomonas]MBU5637698.1 ROK family protein [Geomonas diazotrophica]QWV96237.1 ROK family protein [Geomonas nitrogeniifigens]